MSRLPRVAVLVDLPREAAAGGHVKYWERVAQAAAANICPVDLTVYFSGDGGDVVLSERVRYRFLPPVFSTARLKFLPYVPAHTDLAPFHRRLAAELTAYDVLHTTDAYFAFARTAERVAREKKIPLVTSFHTDTPAYAELFTRQTLQSLLGRSLGRWVDSVFAVAARERAGKEKRLREHLGACCAALAIRPEDRALARELVAGGKVRSMRLGVDKGVFAPQVEARAEVEKFYGIPVGRFVVLFVGRVDAGKNMPLLIEACRSAIAAGADLHLIVAGLGPLAGEVEQVLGERATLAGQVAAEDLARLYAAADCLAVASDIEIGGMVALEALACGCPVLASRVSGVAEACGGTAAVEVVESSVLAWEAALKGLSGDPGRQKEARAAALGYRDECLAGWEQVLAEDFCPVWTEAASCGGMG